ncbi:MAG: 4Fe-4S binding protein [Firmicutes bacterium]|nr:4Fe-4S binding protein [Bacillota bacterium]
MREELKGEKILGLMPADWRYDLLKIPVLGAVLRSRWTVLIGIIVNLFMFAVILTAGWGGTVIGNRNFAIVIIWIVWWSALMMVMVPFASRVWCSACPLPAPAEWIQRLTITGTRGKLPGTLGKKWPKALRNMWLVNFVFMGTAIFSGMITTRPWATAYLLGGIIVLSIIASLIWEKRSFCRYLCPVGGFLGLYSNFASLEIRRSDNAVCKDHKRKECFLGSEEGYGCPWMEAPFDMERNTYCGMCFECLRSCSLNNMAVNLRPWGTDLLVDKKRGLDESWKAFIMLGCAGLYSAIMLGPWGFLKDAANIKTWSSFGIFSVLFFGAILAGFPLLYGAFAWLAAKLGAAATTSRPAVGAHAAGSEAAAEAGLPSFKKVYLDYSYTLVPMGLMGWIAFSFAILFPNISYALPVISDPFGWGWNLLGTADFPWTPFLTGIVPYLQIPTLILGLLFSIDFAVKIGRKLYPNPRAAGRSVTPVILFLAMVTIVLSWLFMG